MQLDLVYIYHLILCVCIPHDNIHEIKCPIQTKCSKVYRPIAAFAKYGIGGVDMGE